jgi:hypothetical protein
MISFNKTFSIFLVGAMALTGYKAKPKNDNLVRAKSTLKQIYRFYDAGHDNLLNETYPDKPGNKVSYLEEAHHIAKSAIDHFTEEYTTGCRLPSFFR